MQSYLDPENSVRANILTLIQYSVWVGLAYLMSNRMFADSIMCPSSLWFKAEDRCYIVSTVITTWNQGQVMYRCNGYIAFCRSRGLYLARFDNFTASMELLKNSSAMKDLFAANDSVWIGANDLKKEGQYIWEDNEKSMGFLPWESKSTGASQDCILLTNRLMLTETFCNITARPWCMAFDISNEEPSVFMVPLSHIVSPDNTFEYLLTTFSTIPLEVNMSLHVVNKLKYSHIFLIYYKRHVNFIHKEKADTRIEDLIKVVSCYTFVARGVFFVHVFKHEMYSSVASFMPLPWSVWGNTYYLVTLDSKPLIGIVAFEKLSVKFRFVITPSNSYFYVNRKKLNNGAVVIQPLQRYQAFAIRFCSDNHRVKSFTGTEVSSTKSIGVVNGNCMNAFSPDESKTSRDSSFEMLLPTKFYGDDFFIVNLMSRDTAMVVIVTAGEEDTTVDVFLGSSIKRFTIVRQGESIRINETTQPFRITSSKGVQVLHVQTSCCTHDNAYSVAGDPSLCVMVPTVLFHFKYMFVPSGGTVSNAVLRNYVIVVARKSTTSLMRLNGSVLKIQGQWTGILGDLKWRTGTAALEANYLYTVSSTNSDYFGCYFLGVHILRSYMLPGGYCHGDDRFCSTVRQTPKFCHCKNMMCEWNGECKTNFDCLPGWFGVGCQYRDMANSSWLDRELIDNNITTCLKHQIKTTSIFLKESITFSWARLIFSSRAAENQITLLKLNKDGLLYDCNHFRYIESQWRSLDVFCQEMENVNKIIFDWQGTGALCSLHIYGGNRRNLASLGSVSYSHGDPIDNASTIANDGITSDGNCIPLSEYDSNIMYMHFQNPLTVSTIVFYVAPNSLSTTSFRVQLLNNQNEMVAEMRNFADKRTKIVSTFNLEHQANKLSFTVEKGELELCEIEVLGDCLGNMYGWDCEKTCAHSCLTQMCNFEGSCHRCSVGITGKLCDRGTTVKNNITTVSAGPTTHMMKTTTVPADACKPGYSGKYCEYICKCSEGLCDRTGECRNKGKCAGGWFAVQCQYSDLTIEAAVNNPILVDGNDSSCSSQKVFSALFTTPYIYSWTRIVFEPGAKVWDFVLIVTMAAGNRTWDAKCEPLRVAEDGPNTFDVFCRVAAYTRKIVVTWEGTGNVCSVYVNGGRILFPHTRISHEEGTDRTEVRSVDDYLTDGDTSAKKCTNIDATVCDQLTFTFLNKHIINRILIYTDLTEGQLSNFSLWVTFDRSVVGYKYNSSGGQRHTIFSAATSVVATIVSIAIKKGSIGICEVEIFGDCPPPYHSLDCNLKCGPPCFRDLCIYNGICHECRGRGSGPFCTSVNVSLLKWERDQTERLKGKQTVMSPFHYLFLVPAIFGIFIACTFIVRNRELFTYDMDHAEDEDNSR